MKSERLRRLRPFAFAGTTATTSNRSLPISLPPTRVSIGRCTAEGLTRIWHGRSAFSHCPRLRPGPMRRQGPTSTASRRTPPGGSTTAAARSCADPRFTAIAGAMPTGLHLPRMTFTRDSVLTRALARARSEVELHRTTMPRSRTGVDTAPSFPPVATRPGSTSIWTLHGRRRISTVASIGPQRSEHQYRINLHDEGEPGIGDKYEILIPSVGYYSGDQELEGGNIQIR